MLLASVDYTAQKIVFLVIVVGVAVIQYGLAVFATARLLKYKSRFIPMPLWHFVIHILIVVGPIFYLLTHMNVTEPRFDIEELVAQKAEREKAEAAAQTQSAENAENPPQENDSLTK